MTFEKYTQELTILTSFVSQYCEDKHSDLPRKGRSITLKYAGERAEPLEALLCNECAETLDYGIARLQGCPFDDKPKCRKCPNPCYERPMWKKVAKIMCHGGIKMGLRKAKNKICFWSNETTTSPTSNAV
ncbi:MAG: nitrous oxide-stimulated promoter family protein [Campylobacterota bacterium]|nr:nitrous oxide-stimulated promoter family protein [Campylobacterota bacterium]